MNPLRIDFIKRIQELQKCLLDWRLSRVKHNFELVNGDTSGIRDLDECQFSDWLETQGKLCLPEDLYQRLVQLKDKMVKVEQNITRKKMEQPVSPWWKTLITGSGYRKNDTLVAYHKDFRNVSNEILKILKELEKKWMGENNNTFISELQNKINHKE